MLSLTTVLEIRRLLAEGCYSQRAIARAVGVSRDTVAAIAENRRNLSGRCPRQDREGSARLARCPGCGGLVHTPCRLCRVRRFQELTRPRTPAA